MSVKTQKEKPEMPKTPPSLTLERPIQIELLHDFDRFRSGSMLMKFADTNVEFTNEKIKGNYGCAIGGVIYVEVDNRLWKVNAIDLINAVLEADQRFQNSG